MAACKINDHVWLAENGMVREMIVAKIFDAVNTSNPLYELAPVNGSLFDYKFAHKDDFFLYHESAIDVAEYQADEIIKKSTQTIELAKCEIRFAKRCKKQLRKERAALEKQQ